MHAWDGWHDRLLFSVTPNVYSFISISTGTEENARSKEISKDRKIANIFFHYFFFFFEARSFYNDNVKYNPHRHKLTNANASFYSNSVVLGSNGYVLGRSLMITVDLSQL